MDVRRIIASAVVVSAALISSAPAEPAGDPLLLVLGDGAAQRRSDKLPWAPLPRGTQPQPGAEVRCPAGCSSSLLWGGRVSAARDSILVALRPGSVKPPWVTSPLQMMRLGLREGTLHVALGKTSKAALLVAAPGVTVLTRAGSADVVARADTTVVAAVDDGVWILRDATWTHLTPGQVVVSKPGEVASAHPRVTAPTWANVTSGRAPIELSASGEPVAIGARWSAVGSADRYRLEIARDASFAAVVETIVTPPGRTAADSAPLPPGGYFARVFAVDADGLESAPSAPLGLRVARAALPPGAFVDVVNRLVILGGAPGIRLVEPEGLEVAVDGRTFGPAPAELSLGGKDQRLIWLRLAGDHAAEMPLMLRRRVLRADVAFTPHLPTWPRDAVTIEVSIVDPSGRLDTGAIKPEIRVMLGSEELPVTWSQRGATWTGQIPSRSLPANEVIRVAASDDFGVPLGLAFVEVAAAPRQTAAAR